jgi:hypothetical protein
MKTSALRKAAKAKEKKSKEKKNGEVKVKLAMDSSRPNNLTNASYTQSQLNKGIQSGKITLRPGSKNIYIVKK